MVLRTEPRGLVFVVHSTPKMAARTSGFTRILLPMGTSSSERSVSQTVSGQQASTETSPPLRFRWVIFSCAVAVTLLPSGRATVTCSCRSLQPCSLHVLGNMILGDRTSMWMPGLEMRKVCSTVSSSSWSISAEECAKGKILGEGDAFSWLPCRQRSRRGRGRKRSVVQTLVCSGIRGGATEPTEVGTPTLVRMRCGG